jgi:toxin ParE1/3/4
MRTFRLSKAAQGDIVDILGWTQENFGNEARLRYLVLIVTALKDIAADSERNGSVPRPELGTGVRSYHLLHSRQRARHVSGVVHRPRHFLLYKVISIETIGIGRILHDAMEVARHLPPDFQEKSDPS